jgi:hypothetical protein
MFSRVIMDTGQWKVSIGVLGLGAVRAISPAGESVSATATEKRYFMQVLRALRVAGVPVTSASPVAVAVVNDFAKSIHQRFRRATATGGFAYTLFFSTFSPEETARKYVEKYQG